MDMKKLIRALIKVPATPFVALYHIIMYMAFLVSQFFEWLYEAKDSDKKITATCKQDCIDGLKKWFTTA